jgi:hypothetical protein
MPYDPGTIKSPDARARRSNQNSPSGASTVRRLPGPAHGTNPQQGAASIPGWAEHHPKETLYDPATGQCRQVREIPSNQGSRTKSKLP